MWEQPTTEEWAKSLGISTAPTPPTEAGGEPCPFTAREIAIRAIILQSVVAVAANVDPEPVVEWLQDQGIWEAVSPNERELLLDPFSVGSHDMCGFQWRQEAEWTLLWTVGMVEELGLPTQQCDTRLMMDEIIPALGSDIEPFLLSATLRSAGELLAENDRHYNLWCGYNQTRREGSHLLPHDLDVNVLYQRQYAFEWLLGVKEWDDVQCDT